MGVFLKPTLLAVFWIGLTSNASFATAQSAKTRCDLKNEFRCHSGDQCINLFDLCDGRKHCEDGSDETHATCWEFGENCEKSQPFTFRCAYGACIDKSKKCNGKEYDCADNSDELSCNLHKDLPLVTSRCQLDEFTCTSGECISLNDVCDGVVNCKNGSDESVAQCSSMSCSPFAFRCAYGACIDFEKKCDDRLDCADGSDEVKELCHPELPEHETEETNSTATHCPFPTHEHTTYSFYLKCKECQPGMPVKKDGLIRVQCPPNYALPAKYHGRKRATYIICTNPPYFGNNITCEKMCPPLVAEFHTLTCSFNGKEVPCHEPMHPGTYVELGCKNAFQPESDVKTFRSMECLAGGKWSDKLYKCIPVCGKATPKKGVNKVAHGEEVSPGEAPWYAGFWENNGTHTTHFCGGSIITPNLIITAAHCLDKFRTRELSNPKTDSLGSIEVAVGKFDSNWTIHGELEQRVGVKRFQEHKQYVGPPTFEKDIAVVELLQNLEFNEYVSPVCVDWEKEGSVRENTQGYIVGFGRNEFHVPSSKLKAARLNFINRNECIKKVFERTEGTRQYISWDHFCAGVDSSSTSSGKVNGVRRGDSGGGYTFQHNGKYYIYGLLSHSLDDDYAVYTDVHEHIDWMKDLGYHETLVATSKL